MAKNLMMGASYFNGDRATRLEYLTRCLQKKNDNLVEDKLIKFHKKLFDEYTSYIQGKGQSDKTIESVVAYYAHGDFMRLERELFEIEFFLDRGDYEKILSSSVPALRFLYSTMSYVVEGKLAVFKTKYESYRVDPKRTEIMNNLVSQEKQVFLTTLGIVQPSVIYPFRESVDDGQMKICVDLFKLVQVMGSTYNQKVLIVGSASQATGGSKSYELLQYMFKDSEFHLYDPHDVNDSYRAKNGNVYFRNASVYVYSPEVAKFNVVQDDAFVSHSKNRQHIDPKQYLFMVPYYSCKKLECDHEYFKHSLSLRQVGATVTSEERAMSHVPMIGNVEEVRFGTCSFCREMRYYCRHSYSDDFFKSLARMHNVGTRCAIKDFYVSPSCDGNVLYKGKMMFEKTSIQNGVSLAYDPVLDYPLVMNFDVSSGRTYVFSSLDNIQYFMYSAKVAVYDSESLKYYTNYNDDSIRQLGHFDLVRGGIKFRYIVSTYEELLLSSSPPRFIDKGDLYSIEKRNAVVCNAYALKSSAEGFQNVDFFKGEDVKWYPIFFSEDTVLPDENYDVSKEVKVADIKVGSKHKCKVCKAPLTSVNTSKALLTKKVDGKCFFCIKASIQEQLDKKIYKLSFRSRVELLKPGDYAEFVKLKQFYEHFYYCFRDEKAQYFCYAI